MQVGVRDNINDGRRCGCLLLVGSVLAVCCGGLDTREVDEKIVRLFTDQISGNEEYLANAAASMTGKTDLFSMAMFKSQLKNIDKEIDAMFRQAPPPGLSEYLGMAG